MAGGNRMRDERILITGGTGFLGRTVVARFNGKKIRSIGREDADLRNSRAATFCTEGVDIVIHLAADCGGIEYNRKNPASLFCNNMMMLLNILEACRINTIKKVVLIGSTCGYPKSIYVPFREKFLWDGYPEDTNAPYGLAKRDALMMAQSYRKQYGMNVIYLLLANLYGEYDHFDDERSHVIPAMIKRFVEAKERGKENVVLWGTGIPTREFLHVEDAAEAIFLATKLYDKPMPINIGTGLEITIKRLAETIKGFVGYGGKIIWDDSKPDGQLRRCLEVTKAKEYFDFEAKIPLEEGLKRTVSWYLANRIER